MCGGCFKSSSLGTALPGPGIVLVSGLIVVLVMVSALSLVEGVSTGAEVVGNPLGAKVLAGGFVDGDVGISVVLLLGCVGCCVVVVASVVDVAGGSVVPNLC